jgi:hypothetical protein
MWPFNSPPTQFVKPGVDPLAPPYKYGRKRIPFKWIAFIVVGVAGLACCGGLGLISNLYTANRADASAATAAPTSTLPAPGLSVTDPVTTPTVEATPTKITAALLLTQFSATNAARTTTPALPPSSTPTSGHFLTQLAYDATDTAATVTALLPGETVNVSHVNPAVTYIYPTATYTPIVVTATPTATDHITRETVVIERIITATPGPTQTPWFFITQPPVVTVIVPVTVETTREVTVIVTATMTDTASPTETPTETQTPTETATP